jgi:hypothetical protein
MKLGKSQLFEWSLEMKSPNLRMSEQRKWKGVVRWTKFYREGWGKYFKSLKSPHALPSRLSGKDMLEMR